MSIVGTRSSLSEVMRGLFKVVSTSSPRAAASADTTPEAYAEWGSESDFNYNQTFGGFEVVEKYDPLNGTLYQEGCRYSDIRVENPENSNQSVIVRRFDAIAFTAPEPSTRKANVKNNHPQVTLTFSNYEGAPVYVNSKGSEFRPVALDPFNSIVDVSWANRLSLIYCYTVAPATGGNVWLTFADPELNAYAEDGDPIINMSDSGSMQKPRDQQLAKFHPAQPEHLDSPAMPASISSRNFSFAGNFPGVFHAPELDALGLKFSNLDRIQASDGNAYYRLEPTYGHLMMRWYTSAKDTTTIPIVGVPDEVKYTNTDWFYEEWRYPHVQAGLYRQTKIPAIGSDAVYDQNLETKVPFWKFMGSLNVHIPFDDGDYEDSEYKIYQSYIAPWTHYYDPSPYIYGCYFVDIPMMLRAIAHFWPNQNKTVELIFNARVDTLDGESGDPYTGLSHGRAIWFSTQAGDVDKLKSLSIDSSKTGYVAQDTILNFYSTGENLSGQVIKNMASHIVATQDFVLPPGTEMKAYPYEHARYDVKPEDQTLS